MGETIAPMTRRRKLVIAGIAGFIALVVVMVVIAVKQDAARGPHDLYDDLREIRDRERPIETTPTEMVQAYRNEIEGDRRYKRRSIRLTATVDGVRRDQDGNPMAVVHTFHEDANPDAVVCALDGDFRLEMGPKVVLRCVGAGLIQGAPALTVCRPE